MHTVFINTTENRISGRFDSLKNAKDLKKLMYVDCPLATWKDEDAGFESAAKQIADFIDTYNYVNNNYNLVIYADMVEFFDLLQIEYFAAEDVEQALMHQLCKSVIARLMASTVLKKLEEIGRSPVETPVLLLEMPRPKEIPEGIDLQDRKINAMLSVLCLVSKEQLKEKLIAKSEISPAVSDLVDTTKKNARIDLCDCYNERIQILADDVCRQSRPLERACEDLYEAIEALYKGDCSRNLAISEYYTNKKTRRISLELLTKHNFLLQCYILDCITDGSAYSSAKEVKQIQPLSDEEWEEIVASLDQKKKIYEAERRKIAHLNVDYVKIGLAPPLFKPANKKFGLNENGNVSSEFIIREVEEDDSSDKSSIMKKREELALQKGVVRSWFDEETYKPYDTAGEEFTAELTEKTVEEYQEKARALANHHVNLFDKFSMHVKRVMANYSCYSISNTPPVLRKRRVNMGESVEESAKNDYKYADSNGSDKIVETAAGESVIETSKRSYISMMIEYLKFDAGRGLAVKSIKEQCEWFINRIKQIDESLKKLRFIFGVTIATLVLLYLPFLLIQWDEIVKNIDTLLIATVSLASPFVILAVCYVIAREKQKRKMEEAWKDLLEQSDKACAENREMIQAYDSLMTKYIPALRWLYEYVLDVEFHCDCCEIARAKLAHHRDKLFELIENLGNFLEDLDYLGKEYAPSQVETPIEYTKAFCEGEKNREFYSIIDSKMIDKVQKRERRFG